MAAYLRPVNPTNGRICTWRTHTRRQPPSKEAGVDYYCPIGTPIRAAGPGRVHQTGGSIDEATGRFLTIDLDDGRRVRYLHLSKVLKKSGARVKRGDIVAKSGASGYGSEFFGASSVKKIPANTGGPHVHTTLWPRHAYSFGAHAGTLDVEKFTGGRSAPVNPGPAPRPTPAPPAPIVDDIEEDDTMYAKPSDGTTVYEVKDGHKRGVTAAEWAIVKAAYAAAGRNVPYAKGTITKQQMATIPDVAAT